MEQGLQKVNQRSRLAEWGQTTSGMAVAAFFRVYEKTPPKVKFEQR